jgi:hypothetical protein
MTETTADKAEASRRGHELYERIRPEIETSHRDEVVAIDLKSGEYEVADSLLAAAQRLRARIPDARTWFVRVGHDALYRFGPRSLVASG